MSRGKRPPPHTPQRRPGRVAPGAAPISPAPAASSRFVRPRRPAPADGRAPANPDRAGGGIGTWLYGLHPVRAALANPVRRVRRLVGTPDGLAALGDARGRPATSIEPMAREALDRLLPTGSVHQGVAILVDPLDAPPIEDLIAAERGKPASLVVVLDQVTDPHNVGAILRTAAAFGAAGLVLPDRHAPGATGTLAKAASGALELVPLIHVANLARALDLLKQADYWIVGLAADAPRALADVDVGGRIVMVFGAEGAGMRRLTRDRCDHLARLPTDPRLPQLNVSGAAAIALYEHARRR